MSEKKKQKQSMFTRAWDALNAQEKQPERRLSTEQIMQKLAEIITLVDEKQQAILDKIAALEHHMQVVHERQIAILDKLNFMVKVEERQITHIQEEMERFGAMREEEKNP